MDDFRSEAASFIAITVPLIRRSALFATAFLLLSFVYFYTIAKHNTAAYVADFSPSSPRTAARFSTLQSIDAEADRKWLPLLQTAKIVACSPFDIRDAYADKFIAEIEGGYKVMIKLASPFTYLPRSLRVTWFDEELHSGTTRSQHSEYQAIPELASFYLDRLLGFYRKPPMVGRKIRSTLLYPNWMTSLLPSFEISVSMHAWMDGLFAYNPDPALFRNFLLGSDALHTLPSRSINSGQAGEHDHMDDVVDPNLMADLPSESSIIDQLAAISDVLLFDFLVDDHDRKAEKNWIQWVSPHAPSAAAKLLTWDNGMGWFHGPQGFDGCLDILCGSNSWRDDIFLTAYQKVFGISVNPFIFDEKRKRLRKLAIDMDQPCHRICRFRRRTVEALRSFSSANDNQTLGQRLKLAMESDPLFPGFDLMSFYSSSDERELVIYPADNFFSGLEKRLHRLLLHTDDCIHRYGREKVLSL